MLCSLVLLIVHGATVFRSGAVMAQQPAAGSSPRASMVFTASDFPALAGGIEVRTSGDAVAQVWSPASQEWRLSQDGDTANLRSLENGGDPLPRWQKLGKVVLRAGHPLKFTLSGKKKPETDQAKAKAKAKEKPDSKSQGDPKTKDEPAAVPALLVLNTDSQADPERVLDLVRGRVDTAGPSPDRRRTEVRTNQEGAEFQPPSSPRPGATARCSSVSRCSWRSASGRCRRRRP